jgi:hypothetical protein
MPGVPRADVVTCPGNHHQKPPPLDAFVPPRFPNEPTASDNGEAAVQTRVSDLIEYPSRGAKWFQSRSGGAGAGAFAVYDSKASVYATCWYEDTAHELQYWRIPASVVPPQIPKRDIGVDFHTARGIRFGDTLGHIESVYGPQVPHRETATLWSVTYTKKGPMMGNMPFLTITSFYFREGRLVGVDRESGI